MCAFFFNFCVPCFFSHFHNCTHPATARVPLFCSLFTPSAIVLCFIVPTHPANGTYGTPRNLFLVTKALQIMFNSLPSANHLCLTKLLSVLSPCRPLQKVPQHIPLLICSTSSSQGCTPLILNSIFA